MFQLGEGEAGYWRLGPLELWLQRLAREWRYAMVSREQEEEAEPGAVEVPWSGELPAPEEATCGRFAFRSSPERVLLQPALADRAVVTRPETPLTIPAGEQVTIYVTSPLWLQLRRDEAGAPLLEVPAVRPSDTWFGPSPLRGELAYASRTRAVLDPGQLTPCGYRAVTPLLIDNRGQDAMLVDRVLVPVPQLELWADDGPQPWTSPVVVKRRDGGKLGEVDVLAGPPEQQPGARRIAPGRQPAEHGVVRALASLF